MKPIRNKFPLQSVRTIPDTTQPKPDRARAIRELQLNPQLIELLLQLLGRSVVAINPTRKITISADMYVEDDETFGSNETTRRQQTNSAVLSTKNAPQAVMEFEVRMGGEVRVILSATAFLVDDAGNATIDGDIKLYEGTSESTGDLDGQRQFQLYCPVGGTINYFVRVNNDDEGGDYATVRLSIANSPA